MSAGGWCTDGAVGYVLGGPVMAAAAVVACVIVVVQPGRYRPPDPGER